MPWARIPPDRLIHLPLFGIHLIADEGDFLWYDSPSGKQRVWKHSPRVLFEETADAHQCGATAILTGRDRADEPPDHERP